MLTLRRLEGYLGRTGSRGLGREAVVMAITWNDMLTGRGKGILFWNQNGFSSLNGI